MALWVCADCSTAYAVGLSACPHCRSTDHHEESTMPKISVHGGPTNAADDTDQAADLDTNDTPEEEPSPGNSSETSSTKPSPSTKSGGNGRRSRARTTENPSSTDPTDSSTAPGTDGAPTAATSEDEPGGGRP